MNGIANWLGSLSLFSLIGLATLLSAGLAIASLRIPSRPARWVLALAVPFVLAWAVYWCPVWFGAPAAEYSLWAPIVVVPGGLAGALGASVILVLHRRLKSSAS